MTIEVRPARNFDDMTTMVGPKRPDATVCWCLSYRIPSKENLELRGPARGERVKQLVQEDLPPGVLAYDGVDVVGCGQRFIRASTRASPRNSKIPHLDDLDVWSVWCLRVRPGHRGTGIAHHLIDRAVEFARAFGAPAIEGYPVDNSGKKVDQTMAYIGTQRLFERAGFIKAAETGSIVQWVSAGAHAARSALTHRCHTLRLPRPPHPMRERGLYSDPGRVLTSAQFIHRK